MKNLTTAMAYIVPKVLQQYAAAQGLPLATTDDKIRAASNYKNFIVKYN